MLIKADMGEATEGKNIPGIYIGKIVAVELKHGRDSGNPYLNWKLLTQPEKRTVFYSTPITGRGAGMFRNLVHSAGDLGYIDGEYDTSKLQGCFVSMDLDVDEKGYFKVKKITALDQLQKDQMVNHEKAAEIMKADNFDDIPF